MVIIILCLAITNLVYVTHKSINHYRKLNNLSPIEPWNEVRKPVIRYVNSPEQDRIEESKKPIIFLALKEFECKYIKPKQLDLSEDIVLDAVIAPGELLIEKSQILIDQNRLFYLAKKKSDGKTVLFDLNSGPEGYPFGKHPNTELSNLFDKLDAGEILISMYYYQGRHHFNNFSDELKKCVYDLKDSLIEKHTYKIFIQPDSKEKGKLHKIKGRFLKDLLEYDDMKKKSGFPEPNIFDLRESIATNDKIAYEFKSSIIGEYINYFFKIDKNNHPSKEKYFDFLIKLVIEYPHKPFSPGFVPKYEIDQHAVVSALSYYEGRDEINANDLIDFCDRVIAVSRNPKAILRAYAAKTFAYLDLGDPDQAKNIAVEALNLYDEPYIQDHRAGVLNGRAAVYYLGYLIRNRIDPETVFEQIEFFNKMAASLPDFQNDLLFIKAIMTDLTANSVEDVIAVYSQVNCDWIHGSNSHDKCKYGIGLMQMKSSYGAIKTLQYQVKEKLTFNQPFSAKKYLLAKEEMTLNESGAMDVTIIQHELPQTERNIAPNDASSWKKAEINGKIFWIQIAD